MDSAIRQPAADSPRILVVEDNEGDARLLREYLSEDRELGDVELVHRRSMDGSLSFLTEHSTDLVLLDLNLPDSRGLDTVRSTVAAAPDTPVVVLTGTQDEGLAREALREGAQDYLTKDDLDPIGLAHALEYSLERKRAELERHAREERFRSLIENISDVVAVARPDGTITYLSPSVTRVLGRNPEELAGEPVWSHLHPDDRERMEHSFREALGSPGEVGFGPLRFRHEDGEWRILEAHGVRPPEEADVDGLVITCRDVTERVEARNELAEKESELSQILRTAGDGIIVTDAEGGLEFANEAAERILGRADRSVVDAVSGGGDFAVGGSDGGPFREERLPVTRVLDGGSAVHGIEYSVRRGDDSRIVLSVNAAPIRGEDGGLRRVVASFRDVTERKQFEARLEHRALHDHLTGLPNRALFADRTGHAIERCRRTDDQFAVLFLDLDRFKHINDTLGHEAGDRVLRECAERLTSSLREPDTVARVGGDEFTVLLEELGDAGEADEVAERITQSLERPFTVADRELHLQASIGIAMCRPSTHHGSESDATEDVIRRADRAMYQAKQSSGSRIRRFDPDGTKVSSGDLSREMELWQALDDGQIVLWYQPIWNLASTEIVGVEALARWDHPERGIVPPDEFIPLAERTGIIHRLGARQLELAGRDMAALSRETATGAWRVHLNVSADQLSEPEGLDELSDALEGGSISPDRIVLEITESTLMRYPEQLRDLYRRSSFSLAIDDFGTRHSTLDQLKKLNRLGIEHLKIDRRFVEGVGKNEVDETIVRAVLALADGLGLSAIAEGVEERRHRDWLRENGCEEAQGYGLTRPVSIGELGKIVDGAG